jgi:Uma2 family endonuclease
MAWCADCRAYAEEIQALEKDLRRVFHARLDAVPDPSSDMLDHLQAFSKKQTDSLSLTPPVARFTGLPCLQPGGLPPGDLGYNPFMLDTRYNLLLSLPKSTPLVEPIRLARRAPDGQPWTIAELEALADDEVSYELVRGDLYMMTPASPQHGIYAVRFAAALYTFVEDHQLGEVTIDEPGFMLQPEPDATVRAPDIAFVQKDHLPSVDQQQGFWPLAPDLVIEIISPSESAESVQEKVSDYLAAGTQLIWLVYPKLKSVTEHRLGAIRLYGQDDNLDGGAVLPGFTLPLKQLFRE